MGGSQSEREDGDSPRASEFMMSEERVSGSFEIEGERAIPMDIVDAPMRKDDVLWCWSILERFLGD